MYWKVGLRRPLTGKGCIWEHVLQTRGFDKLPEEDQHFKITDALVSPQGAYVAKWQDYEFVVFLDEVKFLGYEDEE